MWVVGILPKGVSSQVPGSGDVSFPGWSLPLLFCTQTQRHMGIRRNIRGRLEAPLAYGVTRLRHVRNLDARLSLHRESKLRESRLCEASDSLLTTPYSHSSIYNRTAAWLDGISRLTTTRLGRCVGRASQRPLPVCRKPWRGWG